MPIKKPPHVGPSTVFVLGAGASSEANLPVGSALTEHIAQCLKFRFERAEIKSGDRLVYEALLLATKELEFRGKSISDFTQAALRIARAMPQAISIDNFIDVHAEDRMVELCGKVAIVREILRAEKASIFKLAETRTGHHSFSFDGVRKTYFSSLFQLLTENCKFADLPSRLKLVCFVVFNYDRCLEYYLRYAIANYYAVNDEQATEALKSLRIYHPYGTVGQLPIASYGGPIVLGGEPGAQELLSAAKSIKTFTESTDPASIEVSEIRTAVKSCRRLVFLGFGYHRMNIDLLAPASASSGARTERKLYGTAVGISKSDLELISIDLGGRFAVSIDNQHLSGQPCASFFGEYWRSLSFV